MMFKDKATMLLAATLATGLLPFQRRAPRSHLCDADRIGPTKQHDQQAKLARRARRQSSDVQMWKRQREKWG